jgi:hypothetical protein
MDHESSERELSPQKKLLPHFVAGELIVGGDHDYFARNIFAYAG